MSDPDVATLRVSQQPQHPSNPMAAVADASTVAGWLREATERWPDRPALAGIDADRHLSFGELSELVVGQAERLRGWGIGRGDVVLMALTDGPMALAALLAIASVATVMPVAAQEQPDEYVRILDEVPVRAVLMDDRPHAPLKELAERRGIMLIVARAQPDAPPGTFALRVSRAGASRPPQAPAPGDDALYTLTSGTTAVPKIVAITHVSLWRQMESSRAAFRLTEHDRSLCLMPIAHLHSLIRCSLPVLAAGGSVTWTPGLDVRRVPEWLDRFAPTFISAAPTVHRKLVRACEAVGWQRRADWPRLLSASADRLDAETIGQLESTFGATVVQLYGLSETSPIVAVTPLDGPTAPIGSTGRIQEAWSVTCLDDGVPVKTGQSGEIALSGAIVNRLVGNSGAHTQRFDDAGRYLTGDIGRIDADGFLFVEGRVDDIINRGGQKVHPAVVEASLLSHPAVRTAAAFPIPDAILGSRVAAAVELHDGAHASSQELLEHASHGLRHYMVPEQLHLTDAIPRNELGKVSRRNLSSHFTAAPPTPAAILAPPADVLAVVLEAYQRVLRTHDIDPSASFFELGGDSLDASYVQLDLEARFEVSLAPATFARVSSANALAAYVAGQMGPTEPVRLEEVQSGHEEVALVFAHGMGRGAYLSSSLARLELLPGHSIIALDADGPRSADEGSPELTELTWEYTSLIRAHGSGQHALVGHSVEAHIAFATATELLAQGGQVSFVAVLDDDAELTVRNLGVASLPPASWTPAGVNRHLVDSYTAAPTAVRVVLIRNEEDEADYRSDPTGGWAELAHGGVKVTALPGNHHSLVREASLPALSAVLMAELENARLEAPVTTTAADPSRLLRYQARLACARGDAAGEISWYREAIRNDPEQPSFVYENLARAVIDTGDLQGGLALLDEAIGRDRWPTAVELRFAPWWHAQGLYVYLSRAVDRARRLRVDHPSVQEQRGRIMAIAGYLADAEIAFRNGLATAPAHYRLHQELANVLRGQLRFAEAARVLGEMNEQTPGLPTLVVQLAETHLQSGAPAAAIEVLERNPGVIDQDARGFFVLASALEALGRDDEAIEVFVDAAAVTPGAAEPAYRASLMFERLGRHDEAGVWARRAAACADATPEMALRADAWRLDPV